MLENTIKKYSKAGQMRKEFGQPQQIEAVRVINSLHVAWVYCNPATRKKYHLEKKFAFYHSDLKLDHIVRLEKEFLRLQLIEPDDYYLHESAFGDWNIYTICLTDKATKRLEQMGISISEKFSS